MKKKNHCCLATIKRGLGINSQIKVKLYSEHSHQFFWSVICLVLYLDSKHLWRKMSERSLLVSDFCTSQCHLLPGQGDIPSAPLFISKGKVVCAVFLNLIASYSLSHWRHGDKTNVFITWFEDYSNLVLMVGYSFENLCVFYNILRKHPYSSKCWGIIIQDLSKVRH